MIEFTLVQVNNTSAHAALSTVTNPDAPFKTYPGTTANAAMLAINRLDTARIDYF
ncbi:hypothetical protein NUBL17183_46170 [Klebsiella pneumoniae]|nr:hypothetical protein NUBL17183_46170 [Klebsiella pneumoniae]